MYCKRNKPHEKWHKDVEYQANETIKDLKVLAIMAR